MPCDNCRASPTPSPLGDMIIESKVCQEFRKSGGAVWFEQLWACPPALLAVSEGLDMSSCPWSLGQRGIGVFPALVIY